MKRSVDKFRLAPAVVALVFCLFTVLGHAQTDAAPAAATASGPVLVAKIAANLSTKNAKVGDVVTAKTQRGYKLADGTDVPKGSKITGKLAVVQSKKEGNGDSSMTFRLEEIEVKGGAAIPIHGLVVAIGPSMAPKGGLGQGSVLARNTNPQGGTGVTSASQGTGSSNGMDPNAGLGSSGKKDEDDIPLGSTMDSVALGRHLDADWTTVLKGIHSEINLDSDVLIKVQLK